MIHYKVEFTTTGDLATAYPHNPQDIPASVQDYLEAKLSDGWELVNMVGEATSLRFAFRAHGRVT